MEETNEALKRTSFGPLQASGTFVGVLGGSQIGAVTNFLAEVAIEKLGSGTHKRNLWVQSMVCRIRSFYTSLLQGPHGPSVFPKDTWASPKWPYGDLRGGRWELSFCFRGCVAPCESPITRRDAPPEETMQAPKTPHQPSPTTSPLCFRVPLFWAHVCLSIVRCRTSEV